MDNIAVKVDTIIQPYLKLILLLLECSHMTKVQEIKVILFGSWSQTQLRDFHFGQNISHYFSESTGEDWGNFRRKSL